MDDGDNHKSGYILNTYSITLNGLHILKSALKNKLNLYCFIFSRNRFYIKASRTGSDTRLCPLNGKA